MRQASAEARASLLCRPSSPALDDVGIFAPAFVRPVVVTSVGFETDDWVSRHRLSHTRQGPLRYRHLEDRAGGYHTKAKA